jgi:phosphoglycolate phosphatase
MRAGSSAAPDFIAWINNGAPATLCRTLGRSDFIRVPLPAANMINATAMLPTLFNFSPSYAGMSIAQVQGVHIPCRLVTDGLNAQKKSLRPMGTVIFDLDGTLADTSGDLIAAANSCFRDLGLGDLLHTATDAGTALKGGRAMLRLGFSRVEGFGEADVDDQYQPLLNAYAKDIDTHTVMYPGAMDAIEELKSNGHKVGIATNKPEGLAQELLTRLGVRDAFASLVGADTLAVRKPDPDHLFEAVRRAGGDPAQSCLVGDTATDRNTSLNAGVPSILVTFGPSGEDMAALNPEFLLDRFDDLPAIVERLFS